MTSETRTERPRRGRLFLVAMAGLAVAMALPALAVWAEELGAHRQSRALRAFSPRPPAAWVSPTFAWAWGTELIGQLCNGVDAPLAMPTPVQMLNLTEVTAIAGGLTHSLAAKRDGTVWACGSNIYGALGDGTTYNSATPVQVLNLSGVTAVASGGWDGMALKSDGTVWAWGDNFHGQVGDGTTTNRHTPVQVLNLSGVRAVAAGGAFKLALKRDGTVWAWGWNSRGQLGDGTTLDSYTPVQVQNLSGITAIAAGTSHSLAVKSDGTVWAWGLNGNGQLGDGTTTDRSTPVQVQNLSGVRAVAGGAWHSLALKGDDGTVWAWGWNAFGELGDGTTNDSYTPVQVQNLGGITAIAAGDASNLALTTNGIVQAWGANDTGELGDGTTIDRHTPVTVLNLSGTPFSVAIAIAAGSAQSLAIVKVLPAVVEPPYLAVKKLLAYPSNRFRPPLFNLQIDGVTVRANVTSGSTRLLEMGSGNHIVSETVSTGTDPDEFTAVIGGDCAPDGTVNLAPGDKKVCTITNYDHFGGCGSDQCCKPGEGVQGCQDCRKACP